MFGILRIDDDVIQNIVIAAQVGEPRPIVSAIVGQEKTAGAGTEVTESMATANVISNLV